ncbi:SDR family oxidoreductase [Methylopila sp. Yamaguchi]|uniref:SDR family oxidoreductase n=1 Tax=Methylopila sp. Yamaguchi TaxID=1437817 RepID=UPI000CC59260|nr:SDR family oxidoreductase [Methylopila sp. Yamaguchi]GBD49729.1 short-chain dehydrogenase [Methylopila sp. Yamaguchi]
MKLQGKKVVLLGGTSGIGLAVAQAATAEGAEAVIASSNPGRVDEALAALPAGSTGTVVDLLDADAIARFFETVGAFDHLVYTAGEGLKLSPLASMSLDEARTFFELRYWGALGAAKAAHGKLRPGGSIIFTSGIAGARPAPGWSVAASICSAMEGLTRALAVELAPLRVNIVSPGVVRSPLWRGMDDEVRSAFYADQADRLPVRHVGEPDEVAEAYVYLMAQTYGTGQTLVVDGGGVLV